jgi:N6-adenosine-specific RNA methylase IME4
MTGASEMVALAERVADPIGSTMIRTVVADPPWTPALGATWNTRFTDKARPQKQYDTLTVAEIEALCPTTAKQAHLWLWVLNQHVDWGYQVARAWGFEPQQMVTWKKPGLGNGRFQCNTESVLVCRKGSRHGNPFGASGGTGFDWPRGRHSEKPDDFYQMVETVSPGPYLEMFARKLRSGWTAYGNEVPAMDEGLFAPIARVALTQASSDGE